MDLEHGPGEPPPWELGSEFHWDEGVLVPAGRKTDDWLPPRASLFASGAGALRALLTSLGTRPRVHLPSYFCMPVAAAIAQLAELHWYRQLPGEDPDVPGSEARAGDVVLAVNLFGHGRKDAWARWADERPDVIMVEDHTHDPVSEWALTSRASYCVASLRKTLPVPDGALLWSPAGYPLPAPDPQPDEGASLKHAAMVLKSAWLRGRGVSKDAFRTLAEEGERLLVGSTACPSAITLAALPRLDVWGLRRRRVDNARALLAQINGEGGREQGRRPWAPLFDATATSPFHVPLVCASGALRDNVREHLRRHRVFAPIHWPQPAAGLASGDPRAHGLAGRVLTIPTDHRYGPADMLRVANALNTFATGSPTSA